MESFTYGGLEEKSKYLTDLLNDTCHLFQPFLSMEGGIIHIRRSNNGRVSLIN